VERLVIEMAMTAPGEIADLAGFTHPDVGLLLNVGQAHIGRLGSDEAIAAAKAELLEALPPDGTAVLNADDPRVVEVSSRSRAPVRWFGAVSPEAAWRVEEVEAGGVLGSRATLVGPDGRAPLRLRAPGRHLLLDAAAAAAVAATFGVGIAEAAERLSAFVPGEHRGRVLPGLAGSTIVDDSYNSSPTSLVAALEVLRESGAADRLAIIGDMLELGDRTAAAHREAGRCAAGAATRLIAVGSQAEDAERAADLAIPHLHSGIVVLVKASRGIGLDSVVERLLA
jgi:UDP-N-acetylmuramoyl-tripeptide--D-alanyl-D-alanine ligase